MTSAPLLPSPCAPAGSGSPGPADTGGDDRALDPLDRRVLRLCLRDGLPPPEAALRLGRTTHDVVRLLARVVRDLRLELTAEAPLPAPTRAPATD